MPPASSAQLTFLAPSPDTAASELRCCGSWSTHTIADLDQRLAEVDWPHSGEIIVDGSGITVLDTSGAWSCTGPFASSRRAAAPSALQGLRPEFASLLQLLAAREIPLESPAAHPPPWLERVGRRAWSVVAGTQGYLAFVGESALALLRALRQPRRMRWRPILHNVQTAGFEALPITGLLSFLMGIVIAYQGADQLQRFGANIFVADLVGWRCCASCRRC